MRSSLVFTLACVLLQARAADIPAHQEVILPGLHAYAEKSIAAGEEIAFRVSSSVPYRLTVVKLGPDPENRDNDPVLENVPYQQANASAHSSGILYTREQGTAA